MESLTFQPILPFWLLGLIFVAFVLMLLIGPSFVQLTPKRKWTLALLRLTTLLMALFAVVRPGCVDKLEKTQAAVLLFMLDTSRSMELPHVEDNSTRWGTLEKVILENQGRCQELSSKGIETRFFGFDSRVAKLDFKDGKVELPKLPLGSETDIGSALYQTVLGVRDERLLGVFLLSDGNQNATDPEIEPIQAVQTLNDMEVPLFAVPFGLPGDTGQLADLAITNFAEQHVVNVKNDLAARATLVSRGYANLEVKVDLILIDSTGKETIVKSEFVRPDESYYEKTVELVYRPTSPGEYRLKVRANPMVGELAIRNNELEGFLTVNDKGMRVLMIAGDLNWEQSKLRESLSVNDFIQIDFIEISPASMRNWPITQYEELFSDPSYDVYVFIDLDSRTLFRSDSYTKSLDALADAVLKGKGLLMLGGYHSFGAGLYQQTPLADILPVRMRDTDRQEFNADVRRELHISTPLKLRSARDHFITRIGDSESRKTAWQKLPELVGANRIEVKDNAQVLLESDDELARPILAVTEVGGRVAAFAGDSTWRWKMRGLKEYDQFWRQMILWLAKWDTRTDESISIVLPQRRYQPRGDIKFNVVVNSISEETQAPTFQGKLISPTGAVNPVRVFPVGTEFMGEIDPDWVSEPGLYRIEVEGARGTNSIGVSKREFIVMDRDKEKSNPVANPEQLARLASQTADQGGKTIAPEKLSEILDQLIADPPVAKIEVPIKNRFGDQFTDSAIFLLAFTALLTVEWFLRKKWGLV
jgi:uncharacterized membrane protein